MPTMFLGRFFLVIYVFFTFVFLGRSAFALEVATSCYASVKTGEVLGQNMDEILPMASVSKVATTEWALSQRGFEYRYPTFVDVFRTETPGIYDVHLRGSFDPFFDRQQMHFLVSELNKLDVKHIRTLSFDEYFKFTWDAIGDMNKDIRVGEEPLGHPYPETVLENLRNQVPFLHRYSRTREQARSKGIQLIANPEMKVDKVEYLPSNRVCRTMGGVADFTRTIYSAPMKQLLREMNRKSNNYAADQIFYSLGGAGGYAVYANNKLGLSPDDIVMSNGSGAPLFADRFGNTKDKYYNMATCNAVMTVLKSLHRRAKREADGLASVMVMAGIDRNSTLRTYSSNQSVLNQSLVAKTGTITPNVTLGGLVMTQNDDYLFYENIATGRTQWSSVVAQRGRNLIKSRLTDFINENGGRHTKDISVPQFFTYGPEFNHSQYSCNYRYQYVRHVGDDQDAAREREARRPAIVVTGSRPQ